MRTVSVAFVVPILMLAFAPATLAQLTDLQPGPNFPAGAIMFGTSGHTENIDVGDVDNDGDLDVGTANGGDSGNQQNRLFINRGGLQGDVTGTFDEETATRWAGVPTDRSRDIEFVDIDNDADLDVYVSNRGNLNGQVSRFYVNQGGPQGGTLGFFVEETQTRWGKLKSVPPEDEDGLQNGKGPWKDWSCDCDFADLDDDGDLDLFHSSYGMNINGEVESRIFLNDGTGVFDELWPWADADADIKLHTLDIDLADFDGDYDIDVFASSRESQARVYVNNCYDPIGLSAFTDVTQTALIDTGATLAGVGNYEGEVGDLDGDGDFDMWMKDYDVQFDVVLENLGNTPGVGPTFGMTDWIRGDPFAADNEADFLDYDGDGDLDVWVANFSGPNWLFVGGVAQGLTGDQGLYHRSGAGGSLAPWDEMDMNNSGTSLDGETADLDGDGDPDLLLANDQNQPNRYFENVLGVPDTHAPTFHQVSSPCDKPEGTGTPVHAQVRDNAAYYTVAFYETVVVYSVDGGPEQTVAMTSQGGQQFRGVVPSVAGDVDFRVESTDRAGNTGVSATGAFTQSGAIWTDLGFALAGTGGDPLLVGAGTWEPGTSGSIQLTGALGGASAGLFLSFEQNPTPFKGGTLITVPFLDPILVVLPPDGALDLVVTKFPKAIPCGTEVYAQWVIQDPGAVAGFALSNAVRAVTP